VRDNRYPHLLHALLVTICFCSLFFFFFLLSLPKASRHWAEAKSPGFTLRCPAGVWSAMETYSHIQLGTLGRCLCLVICVCPAQVYPPIGTIGSDIFTTIDCKPRSLCPALAEEQSLEPMRWQNGRVLSSQLHVEVHVIFFVCRLASFCSSI
jgi:hypothetical protein